MAVPGRPPFIDGITEPEESPMHNLIVGQMRRGGGGAPASSPPSSGRLVRDILKMLEMLSQMDPRLSARASRAMDVLKGTDDDGITPTTPSSIRFGGGGKVKTPV